jgi:hypothetical protein
MFTVMARAPGRTALLFKCWRPWADESSVIDRFVLMVEVTARS